MSEVGSTHLFSSNKASGITLGCFSQCILFKIKKPNRAKMVVIS